MKLTKRIDLDIGKKQVQCAIGVAALAIIATAISIRYIK